MSYLSLDSVFEFDLVSLTTMNIPEVSKIKMKLVTLHLLGIVILVMVIGCQ